MKATADIAPAAGRDLLEKAAAERAPLALSFRDQAGWHTARAELAAAEPEAHRLVLINVLGDDRQPATLTVGMHLGASLRSGHRKCVFDTYVIDERATDARPGSVQYVLAWPGRIEELQRRLYHRVRVPDRLTIPVDLCREGTDPADGASCGTRRGILVDFSAGGMNVALSASGGESFKQGDLIRCAFALERGDAPHEVTGRLRHIERAGQGHLRVGLQFIGLEAGAAGRRTLETLSRTASKFRRLEPRR